MQIRYLNGNRLYYAFIAGAQSVIKQQDYLNRINVFPVPDADTGNNLAATFRAIMQEFERMTGGREALLPGTLYASIARMLESDLIEETAGSTADGGDRRRRYYRLTPFGRQVAQAESARMQGLLDVAREQSLLPGEAR